MLTIDALVLRTGAWVLAQAAGLPDTIVTKQAPIDPGFFERTTQLLDALLTFSFIALAVAVIPAAWNFRKSYAKVSDLLDRVYADVNPITHHASRIAENVDYVSTAIRADVDRASALLTDAERRLQRTIAKAEARARELEALLAVAQEEAEATFVSAASTVRGVQASVRSLRTALDGARSTGRARGEAASADALLDDALLDDEVLDDVLLDEALLDDALPGDEPLRDERSGDAVATGLAGAPARLETSERRVRAAEPAAGEETLADDYPNLDEDFIDVDPPEPSGAERPRIRSRPRRSADG